mmetsp:Transcript_31277/g.67225  ORF Transcript_31277/g.67225 Transcript_31277/m.67225 type:complete len:222 (-) Transcript_31277:125-790(-)
MFVSLLLASARGLNPPPFVPRRVYMDWVALNARSTPRHIMQPRTRTGREACVALKQELAVAQATGAFVVDAFSALALEHSIDEESRADGGLLGRRIRQGTCPLPEIDRAAFCTPLGQVAGPLESTEGYHLVLVEERLGMDRFDAGYTRVVPTQQNDNDDAKRGWTLASPDPDEASELLDTEAMLRAVGLLFVTYVGGQLIAVWASSLDVEQLVPKSSYMRS